MVDAEKPAPCRTILHRPASATATASFTSVQASVGDSTATSSHPADCTPAFASTTGVPVSALSPTSTPSPADPGPCSDGGNVPEDCGCGCEGDPFVCIESDGTYRTAETGKRLFDSVDAAALERVSSGLADVFAAAAEVIVKPLITDKRIGPGVFAAGLAKAHLDGAASAIFAGSDDALIDDALIDDVVHYLRATVARMRAPRR